MERTYYEPGVVRHLCFVYGEFCDRTGESLLIIGGEMPLGQVPDGSQGRSWDERGHKYLIFFITIWNMEPSERFTSRKSLRARVDRLIGHSPNPSTPSK